jgi:phosphoribosylglycinamide formyltransferase 1
VSRARIAVLASGGGSNLQALLDHFLTLGTARGGDVVLVASDRPDAGALRRAGHAGIDATVIRSRRASDAPDLDASLESHDVDLVVLAGYLQLIPAAVTRRFAGRMLNVHPAPLPAFGGAGMYGARVHRAVIAASVPLSGPTVHFVDEQYDHGAVIAHWPVPVVAGDDDHALAARVLRAEHVLLPRVVDSVAAGRISAVQALAPCILPLFDESLDAAALGAIADGALARYSSSPISHTT